MQTQPFNAVTDTAAAPPADALAHFAQRLSLETDCWDVHSTQSLHDRGFILLDVRSAAAFDRGHVPGAIHLPHASIDAQRLAAYPDDALFVVYCAGPHCNAAHRAAARIAGHGRRVKEMIGGVEGWKDEGFDLEAS